MPREKEATTSRKEKEEKEHHHGDDNDEVKSHKRKRRHSKRPRSSERKKRSKRRSPSSSRSSSSASFQHEHDGKEKRRSKHRKAGSKQKHDSSGRKKEKKEPSSGSKSTKKKDIPHISTDDYFLKNPEFRVWLKNQKDVVFDDLNATEAREYFDTFAVKWNSGKLSSKYYTGDAVDTALQKETRTRHTWNFTKKLTEDEKLKLDSTKDSVVSSTRHSKELLRTEG